MSLSIEAAREVTPALLAAMQALLPQLTGQPTTIDGAKLTRLLAAPGITLLVARTDDGRIVGVATLVHFEIPSGSRVRIEDVVVDASARGQGVGAALTLAALRLATELGAINVDLTSSPHREAANRLYEQLGFERRVTNVYRYDLTDQTRDVR